jgi:hypothetical protein
MPDMPETDLRRIERFCADMWPERFHDEVFAHTHLRGRNARLCETRVVWKGGADWMHCPFAQLRWRPDSRDWKLYWADRRNRWHEYDAHGPVMTGSCAELLAEIDADPTFIFKG